MITEKKIIQTLNEWEFGANLKNGDFVRGVSREHYESIAKEIVKNNDLLHSVSEIRGKLTPIVNLIAIIENGVPNKSDKHHKVYLKEIDNCKRVINELAEKEVYSR